MNRYKFIISEYDYIVKKIVLKDKFLLYLLELDDEDKPMLITSNDLESIQSYLFYYQNDKDTKPKYKEYINSIIKLIGELLEEYDAVQFVSEDNI